MFKIKMVLAEHVILWMVSWILVVTCANDVHKQMTIEELKHTFHVDHHDLVPEYEIVHIHHMTSRSTTPSEESTTKLSADSDSANSSAESKRKRKKFGGKFEKNSVPVKPASPKEAKIRLHAFGTPLDLSLVRTEGLFKKSGLKIWTVEPNATAQHGVEYVEIPTETHEDIGEIYQDEHNQAALLLRKDEELGHIIVEGSVGSDLVIKPLPARLRPINAVPSPVTGSIDRHDNDQLTAINGDDTDDEMFLDDDGELSAEVAIDTGLPIHRASRKNAEGDSGSEVRESLGHHVVFKRKEGQDDENIDYAFMEPDHMSKRYKRNALNAKNLTSSSSSSHNRKKREAPYTIYPEILVIVDYDGYRLHGGDNLQIKRYFVSFWNGVDLRYKLLKGPKIRISIAGIIISRGRDATPYLERNRVGRDAIDSAAALTDMGKYLFRERRLPVYDIAVAITKYDMCRRRKGGRCTKGTAGFAYVGGACVVNKRLEKVNSVAIIEDTGGFSGIIVAAHEVGHLLGAVHDGSPPPSYLGGPGAEKCQWTDGYIMSDLRHTERGFRWSSCSVASFHHFLNGDTATCLYNSPHEDDGLPRVLPGKLLTLDAQCRRDRGTSACFKDDRVCAQLFCFDAGSGYCVAYRPAAEGSPCGDGQYCLNGRCVAEHENIIPDYSQNTPSYIRRDNSNNQGRPLFHEEDAEDDVIYASPPRTYYQPRTTTTTQTPYNYYTTENPYYYSSTTTRYPYYTSSTTTTAKPYYYSTTTKSPYYTTSTTTTTKQPYYQTTTTKAPFQYNHYSISTTKSPYDFHSFIANRQSTTTTTSQRPVFSTRNYFASYTAKNAYNSPTSSTYSSTSSTTLNPYVGNYYQLRQKTTRNPYNFANFGRTEAAPQAYNDDTGNNYLKRSYNAASYYSDSSNIRNMTVLTSKG